MKDLVSGICFWKWTRPGPAFNYQVCWIREMKYFLGCAQLQTKDVRWKMATTKGNLRCLKPTQGALKFVWPI
jgi:hypothetical protein